MGISTASGHQKSMKRNFHLDFEKLWKSIVITRLNI